MREYIFAKKEKTLAERKEGEQYTEGEKRAQQYANMGYVVIAAWKNPKKSTENRNASHYATVRPGFECNDAGPMLANVGGGENGEKRTSQGFAGNIRTQINWYYNPKQDFQESAEDKLKELLTYYGIN